jgi:hypothetical protein
MTNAYNVPDLFADIHNDVKKDPFFDAIALRIYIQELKTNAAYVKTTGDSAEMVPPTAEHKQLSNEYARDYTFALKDAAQSSGVDLYYCNEEMSKTVELAASLLDGSDIGSKHILPSEMGFCYFNGGVATSDNMTIHGLFWFPVGQSAKPGVNKIMVHGFNDATAGVDGSLESWINKIKERGHNEVPTFRWIWRTMVEYKNNEPIAISKTDPMIEIINKAWKGTGIVPTNAAQVLHALSLLMKQEKEVITIEKKSLVSKSQIKRAKKKKIPTEVTVIDVFRSYETSGTSTHTYNREYSRRWLVVGHWRWQRCKDPNTGEPTRKRVWVNAYIKGPKDKPFVATKRVHALLK